MDGDFPVCNAMKNAARLIVTTLLFQALAMLVICLLTSES
jgi:hypothetical protein